MRWMALASLVGAASCNWAFGLEATISVDAALPVDGPPGTPTYLLWGIANGTAPPVFAPIGNEAARAEAPLVMVGPALGAGPLVPASYDTATGFFFLPHELRDRSHRIVYQVPGESIEHEVQWAVVGATLVVPRTTTFDAPTVPPGSGYKIKPVGLPGGPGTPTVATTGVFTYAISHFEVDVNGAELNFRFPEKARALAGPLGAPTVSAGAKVLYADWASNTNTQSSVDGWAVAQLDLQPGMLSMPAQEPPWIRTRRTIDINACPGADCLPQLLGLALTARFAMVFGQGQTPNREHIMYGSSPSLGIPAFLPGVAPAFIERPLLLSFMDSTTFDQSFSIADPTAALGLDRVFYARATHQRMYDGVPLTRSIHTITNTFSGRMPFPAPLVSEVRLGTTDLGVAAPDGVVHPVSSAPVALTFSLEATYVAHDFVVTLYEIAGGAMTPLRVYHVIAQSVRIDSSLLQQGHTYVFGITARYGLPEAQQGDYRAVSYPFGAATTFGAAFVVGP